MGECKRITTMAIVATILLILSICLNMYQKFGNLPNGKGEIERALMQVEIDSLTNVANNQTILIEDYKAENDSLKGIEVEPKIIKQIITKKAKDEIEKYNALPPNGRVQSWSDRARE